jgi:hypothetical protein
MSTIPTVTFDPNNPDKTLEQIAERDNYRYQQDYVPVEDKLIASLNDTSIIESAKERAGLGFESAQGRAKRDQRRYGVRTGAIDAREQNVGFLASKARSSADIVNNARLDQFDRNRTLRNELINIGRGVAADANAGFANSAAMKTQRDNTNATIDANARAQRISTVGSLASTALMAAMVL